MQSSPGTKGFAGGLATGFGLDDDHILTAGHFCAAISQAQKRGLSGKYILVIRSDSRGLPRTPMPSKILAFDAEKDICILQSKDHSLRPLPLAESVAPLTAEDRITVIGAPHGFFPVRRDGRIISSLAYRYHKFSDMLFLAVNIEKGSSGSPVIKDGFVVGMIVILPHDLHEAALAVPIDEIREFIDKTIKEVSNR